MPDDQASCRAQPRRTRYSLSALFLLMLCCAIAMAWYMDHRRLSAQIDLANARLAELQSGAVEDSVSNPVQKPINRCATPEEFVAKLRGIEDWYEFNDRTAQPFAASPVADEALPTLLELLGDPDPTVRFRTLSTLGKMRRSPEVIVPAVIPLLDDEVLNVQWYAAYVFDQLGPAASAAIPELRENMLDDSCGTATFCALALKKVDPTTDIGPRLLVLLGSPIRENRWRAASELSNHVADEIAEAALAAAYETESDQEIREIIARSLNQIDRRGQ